MIPSPPAPPVDSDSDWVARVAARILLQDPRLDEREVRHIVSSLGKYPDWRALEPDAAAAKVFQPPESGSSP
ncbi:hypothetical protein [Rhizobacter sp. Root1221]|uniref:hypothetical protein n=1 Tax=Rhizobacter sp. Root1221 TaxID=1736433 RepID=UPI0006FC811B|nr:hypothetical protein [Rhizobacter sp. Root1221]KQV92885.1 hypothetical protein ASC87_27420 [Rhizobacter sp. Root1221]